MKQFVPFALFIALLIGFSTTGQHTTHGQSDEFEAHVIFEATTNNTWGVYVADVNQLQVQTLIERDNNGDCPVVSPDRTMIVYRSIETDDNAQLVLKLHLVDIATDAESIIATFAYDGLRDSNVSCQLVWSPDNQWVRVAGPADDEGFFYESILNINTGDVRQLTNDSFNDRLVAWSNDSQSVFLVSRNGLIRVDIDTLHQNSVIEIEGCNCDITLNATQDTAIVWRYDTLSLVDLQTQESIQLDVNGYYQYAIAPNGDRIAITGNDGAYLYQDGELQQIVFGNGLLSEAPVWSPDSNLLLMRYQMETDGDTESWLVSMDADEINSESINVMTFLHPGSTPVFVNDGQFVVFYRFNVRGDLQLYRMQSDGSNLSPIPDSVFEFRTGNARFSVRAYPY